MMQGGIRRLLRGLDSVRVGAGVLVLLSMLPSAALLVGHALAERAALLGAARLRAIETARLLADNQENLSRELYTELALLAPLALSGALSGDVAGCNATAASARRLGQVVLSVTDATGRLVCSSLPGAIGKDLSDTPSVRALLAADGPARQQIFPPVGRLLGVPEMVNLVALRDAGGRRVGVAAAAVPFERLMNAARATGRGAEDPIFLIDATTGEILARATSPEGWVGRRFPEHTVLRAFRATGREGVVDGPNPLGAPRVFGYAPLRADGRVVLVVASVGRTALLARANQALLMSLLLAGALTLLGAAGAWWTAHLWLLRPLRRLAALARRLGEGAEAPGASPPARPPGMPRELRLLHAQLLRRGRSLLRARAALAGREAEARLLADHCSDIILRMDRDMRITFVSSAAQAVLGVTPARFTATPLEQAIHPEDLSMVRASMARLRSVGHAPPLTYRRRAAQGWVWLENAPHAVPGGQGYVCVLRDVTRRREAERQVRHMAHHDALTGLANRHKLHRGLEAMLAAAPMAGPVRVLCLDLDRFKEANDHLGHAVGDEVLREIARRLLDFPWGGNDADEPSAPRPPACPAPDGTDPTAPSGPVTVSLAARLGGDEFAVALQGQITPAALAARLQGLIRRLSEPMQVEGHLVQVGASIGVALHPEHGDDPTALLRVADAALYRAKRQGRGCVVLHPWLEAALRDAG